MFAPVGIGTVIADRSLPVQVLPLSEPRAARDFGRGYSWPGNVRERQNSADRMVLGLPLQERTTGDVLNQRRPLDEQLNLFERHLLREALAESGGRAAAASELLGVPKKTFYDKLKRVGLSVDDFKTGST